MKRDNNGPVVIILSLFVVMALLVGLYAIRFNQKSKFDKLRDIKQVLTIDLGEVDIDALLEEKNSIIKKINQDAHYYFIINEKNTAFAYYTNWYYFFDPLQGYTKTFEEVLTSEKKEAILNAILEKTTNDYKATVMIDYLRIEINDEYTYIDKHDLQDILHDNDIVLPTIKTIV